jgi:hypothetical protein
MFWTYLHLKTLDIKLIIYDNESYSTLTASTFKDKSIYDHQRGCILHDGSHKLF